ncbi:hypothetical protein [Azohydromonas australica]|uniref:hypothetical protein n=1 Tax=Azohydromonas australica TaxID=364039 RepID=UPI0005BCDBA4|nr:hypothetical protein [Azohydromonas australica]
MPGSVGCRQIMGSPPARPAAPELKRVAGVAMDCSMVSQQDYLEVRTHETGGDVLMRIKPATAALINS